MKYGIIGSGAIGGYYGGKLAKAGPTERRRPATHSTPCFWPEQL